MKPNGIDLFKVGGTQIAIDFTTLSGATHLAQLRTELEEERHKERC
jgi:hypothetical protein